MLISSGLLVRSFWALSHVDPGYDTEDIFTFQIAPQGDDLVDAPSYARFHMDFMDQLRALPAVASVGILENVPLNEGVGSGRFQREEQVGGDEAGTLLSYTFAAGDVFETMGIDLLDGRTLGPDDLVLGLGNVVINQSTAHLLWPGGSPLGRRIRSETTGATYTVVGVVEDVLQYDFRDSPLPMVYLPLVGQTPTSWIISTPGYVVKNRARGADRAGDPGSGPRGRTRGPGRSRACSSASSRRTWGPSSACPLPWSWSGCWRVTFPPGAPRAWIRSSHYARTEGDGPAAADPLRTAPSTRRKRAAQLTYRPPHTL